MYHYEVTIHLLLQSIRGFDPNNSETLTFILMHIVQLFSEVREDNTSAEHILPQLRTVILLLQSKTQKTFESMLDDLESRCVFAA